MKFNTKSIIPLLLISVTNPHAAAQETGDAAVSWGSEHDGGRQPAGLTDVTYVYGYTHSMVNIALNKDGTVIAWGNEVAGGRLRGSNAVFVTCNASCCAYLTKDGTAISNGAASGGGGMHVPNASQISCGFWTCAVLKKDGTVVAFGHWKDSPTITNASFVDCGQNGCKE